MDNEEVLCSECKKPFSIKDIETCPDGTLICLDCLSFDIDFGEEEYVDDVEAWAERKCNK